MGEIKINLKKLEESNIIDSTTREKIEAFYKKENTESHQKKFLSIFTILGSIITGIGILLFVAANWQDISNSLRTIILFSSTLAFYFWGYMYSYRIKGHEKTGSALMLLWALSYGASIFLLGQIYNIGSDIWSQFWLWSLGVLPLAYISSSLPLFWLWILTLYATLVSYLWENYSLWSLMYSLCLIVFGYLNLSLVRFHSGEKKMFWKLLTFFWSISVLGNMIFLSFSDFWSGGFWSQSQDNSLYICLFSGLIIALVCIFLESFKNKKIALKEEAPFIIWAIAIVILIAISTQTFPPYNYEMRSYLMPLAYPFNIYLIFANLIFLGVIGIMIYRGIEKENSLLVNTSIFFFAVYLFGKYLAFAFDSKFWWAFVFITWGLVCIAIGWGAEYFRRKMISKIK